MPPAIEIIAHRGAGQGFVQPDTAPENTLPAFAYAWSCEVNADAAEADIHLTRDGQIVVIHDVTTDRTTNARWVVATHTLAELRSLDAGSWKAPRFAGIRLPALEDVIETIPEGKRLFTEIKTGPQIAGRLAQVLRHSGRKPNQMPLISFNIDSIRHAKEMLPDHECYLLVSFDAVPSENTTYYQEGPDSRAVIRPAGPSGLDALMDLVDQAGLDGVDFSLAHPPSLRTRLRDRLFKAVVWTVNDVETARQMASEGIGSITTDVPKQMRAGMLG
ncbi:MAG TPA: glycerophosphodiester phosphodiesterase family protein [Candidatus Acidoferrales bacterium]|jgi:glycerophosphoryl diester phosphodiesterase|nr:glycerophosphodiester phosphodiesterase family protein [Candidatus Acidoferrales bacterium]